MSSSEYCEEKGAPAGSEPYYRRLFAPASRQAALTALYAFGNEVGSIPDDVSEPGAARMKLAWWQSELERLYQGEPRHPITRELLPAVEHFGLQRERFDELVALADEDIEHPGHADDAALLERAGRAAALQRLETEICGYVQPETRVFAREMGAALELARIVRDLRADALQGRVHVPLSVLDAHGVRPADLLQRETSAAVRALLEQQLERARGGLEAAEARLPAIDHRAQASALVGSALQRALLAEIERDGYRVLEHRIALTPVRKLWIGWRTVRGAARNTRRANRMQNP